MPLGLGLLDRVKEGDMDNVGDTDEVEEELTAEAVTDDVDEEEPVTDGVDEEEPVTDDVCV